MISQQAPCPCHSGNLYQNCCHQYISQAAIATTPEQLMRSRFSAFFVGDIPYLIATHHPSKQDINEAEELAKSIKHTQWLSLRILSSSQHTTTGEVEFVAFYRPNGKDVNQLHERSNFILENGQWFYTDGVFLPDIKLGRNDNCWCGSGKKLKKCHVTM